MTTAIIISHASNPGLRLMTANLIKALNADPETEFQIIVVEGNPDVKYQGAKTIPSCTPFNYNRACNLGIAHAEGEYIAILNNDLIPHNGWAAKIAHAMDRDTDLLSASPWCGRSHPSFGVGYCTGIQYGHKVRRFVAGWAIMFKRELIGIIGPLDEGVEFHYSDDLYIAQLKKHGVSHALVTCARVDHLESRTLHTLDSSKVWTYTHGQKDAYTEAIKERFKGVGVDRKIWE